jgi:DNA-binding MarR family transcriptional regulator
MSIIRVKKDGHFFVVSNEPFNDERLSWEASGVLGYLLSKPDTWELRTEDLIKQRKAGKQVITRIINELKKAGYIRRYQHRRADGTFETITEIYESPRSNPDFTAFGWHREPKI